MSELSVSDHLHLLNGFICQMMKRGDIKTSAVQELFDEVGKVRAVANKQIGEYIDKVWHLEFDLKKANDRVRLENLDKEEEMKEKVEQDNIMYGVN